MNDTREYEVRLAGGVKATARMPHGMSDSEMLRMVRSVQAQRFGRPPRTRAWLVTTALLATWFGMCCWLWWLVLR